MVEGGVVRVYICFGGGRSVRLADRGERILSEESYGSGRVWRKRRCFFAGCVFFWEYRGDEF